jgi:hypothetical protein
LGLLNTVTCGFIWLADIATWGGIMIGIQLILATLKPIQKALHIRHFCSNNIQLFFSQKIQINSVGFAETKNF